mgnify:CR=1 FL=1
MALGNANTSAQARGKNKATKIKKRKEIVAAASYTAFNCGTVAANSSDCCSGGNTGNTFYHDGNASFPVVNNIVYSSKRARNPNRFTAGFYKFTSSGRSATVEINNIGVVLSRTNC